LQAGGQGFKSPHVHQFLPESSPNAPSIYYCDYSASPIARYDAVGQTLNRSSAGLCTWEDKNRRVVMQTTSNKRRVVLRLRSQVIQSC
jgi:hypothetical protein